MTLKLTQREEDARLASNMSLGAAFIGGCVGALVAAHFGLDPQVGLWPGGAIAGGASVALFYKIGYLWNW